MVNVSPSDTLWRGIADGGRIRFAFVKAPETVSDGIRIHNADPLSGILFAEAMLCTLLTVPLMKGEQRTTVRWEYTGAVGKILCESDDSARLRAVLRNPHLMGTIEDENVLFGDSGTVSIVRSDLKSGSILSSGTTRVELQSVADDFAFLLCLSDQIETEAFCSVRFRADPETPIETASAVMIQTLPGSDLERFEKIRRRMRDNDIQKALFSGEGNVQERLEKFFSSAGGEGGFELFEGPSPAYACSCERQRMIQSVKTLGAAEADHLFADRSEIELVCQFCRKSYKLKREELDS